MINSLKLKQQQESDNLYSAQGQKKWKAEFLKQCILEKFDAVYSGPENEREHWRKKVSEKWEENRRKLESI